MGNSPSILDHPREFVELQQLIDYERMKGAVDSYVENRMNGPLKDRTRIGREFTKTMYQMNKSYIQFSLNSDEMILLMRKV